MQTTKYLTQLLPRLRYIGGRGIVFDQFLCLFVYTFLYLFLCLQDYEKMAGRICMKFSGKVRTVGRPDSVLGQIGETVRCRNANFFYIICQHYEQTAGPICMKLSGKVWSDHGMT